MRARCWSDGGNRKEIAACAAVIQLQDGRVVEAKTALPGGTTNMEAEYAGLILALETCLVHDVTHATFQVDNQTVARHLQGEYKVRDKRMRFLFDKCVELAGEFVDVEILWAPREENKRADALCREVMDAATKKPAARKRPGGPVRKKPVAQMVNPFAGR